MYKLTFNSGDDFYAFGNLNIGSKKVKQNEWFAVEPQNISFDLLYYPTPNTEQEVLSNSIIDSIFVTGQNYNGILTNAVIRLYKDNVLLFTGIPDLSQSKNYRLNNEATVFCYDYLKVFSLLYNDDVQIQDDSKTFSQILNSLKSEIDNIGFNDLEIDNQVILNSNDIGTKIIDTGKDNDFIPGFQDYPLVGLYHTGGTLNENILYFYYINAESVYDTEIEEVNINYQYILISISELQYSRLINVSGTISYDPLENYAADKARKNLEINIIQKGFREYWNSFSWLLIRYGLTFEEITIQGLTYSVADQYQTDRDKIFIAIFGNMFGERKSWGKYIVEGENEENKTNIIDVLKMFLMTNDLICYSENQNIKIISYKQYAITHNISTDNVIELSEQYQAKNIIDDISAIDNETDTLLEVLNEYNNNNISNTATELILFYNDNVRDIKVGDRVIISDYDINIFVIQIDNKLINDNCIKIKGIAI